MDKLLLRPEEAALMLGIGRSRLYQLLAARLLPTVRVGHSIRVPADALREWIAVNTSASRDAAGQR
jgi:excisionase family DNA binding protein